MQTLTIANPTYIFCPIGVADQLAAAEGYRDLTAVQEGRVYEIDEQLIRSQGWGMLDAAIAIAGAVYPELIGEETSEPQEEGGESSSGTDGESSASSESSGDTEMRSVLQIGDTGEDVRRLQERLDELGYMYLPSTGEFGEGTEQAIKDFQLLNGYAATGIADETTQEVLFSDNVRTGPYYGQ
ncbi:MAG TPA: peptidoglycan-binding protein [Candidatus Gallacutalibacter pullicola]|uniref:Peptidoglycan-binding protein n=1 Tax=Candidatus Gallacutalibacter pullicola TaxID=2840830 RepID=A0A9D1DNJ8_9FIRM|nr:peptidoglycan-binding protein [Candidatus Gallacutalibacter pullicola]